jgi:hypothetical protein
VQVLADGAGVRRGHLVAVELLHRGDRQVLLAGPPAVDGGLADAGAAGDLVHGHAVEAAQQDQRRGRREDAAVCLGVTRSTALAAYFRGGGGAGSGPHGAGFHAAEHRFARTSVGNFSEID